MEAGPGSVRILQPGPKDVNTLAAGKSGVKPVANQRPEEEFKLTWVRYGQKLRVDNPGKGPHSIIGPIAVNKAEPGDVLEIRYERIRPYQWGAVFNNPGALGTGLLPQDYAQGQVKYGDLDLRAMKSEFLLNITIPLKPF